MNLKRVLESIDSEVDKEKLKEIKSKTDEILSFIREEIKKQKIDADVFLGGSLAKGTIAPGRFYDIDIFVRFGLEYEELSSFLEKIIDKVAKNGKYVKDRIHGSRDYFRMWREEEIVFEIIPVSKIKKPNEARNVTDLSYFHVNYVKNALRGKKTAQEIVLAKKFCKSNGIYGAESYVNGFSGYGLECLIIYYKTFENMIKSLIKVKDRIIIDPAKKFRKKEEALFELNESKLKSPIILIDPTYKERNALAALSRETFENFKEIGKKLIKKPSTSFFEKKGFNKEELESLAKKSKAELLEIVLNTDRQEGDIAGTKLKKFSNFVERELSEYFKVLGKHFEYDLKNKANLYLILQTKKDIVRIGPPLKMKEAVKAFRKNNRECFEKNGFVHSRIKINFSGKEFLERFKQKYKDKIKEMDITELCVG